MSAVPDIAASAADHGREEDETSVKPAMARVWWVYAIPMAVAAVVRLWLLAAWFNSPFRWYREVSGLDMQTHVREVVDFIHGHRGFSLYYLLNAPGALLGGPEGMIAVQAVLGILTAGLIALAALRFYGSRTAAMLAGLLAGLYAPAALYEMFHLKESVYLFAASLGLALLIEARHRRFAPGWAFAAGAAITLPALVRFPGVLWMAAGLLWAVLAIGQRDVRHSEANTDPRRSGLARLRRCVWPVVGAASILIFVTLFNLVLGHHQLPFGSGPGIAFYLRGEVAPGSRHRFATPPESPATDALPAAESTGTPATSFAIASVLRKSAETVQTTEIPNNLNFYFIRDNLRPLRWLIQPQWFLPAAFVGLLLLLLARRRRGFLVLSLLFAASYVLPMILFVPLARYRLALLPVLSLWAVFPWVALRPYAGRLRHAWMLFLWLGLLALAHQFMRSRDLSPGEVPLRVSDFLVYADACRQDPRRMPEMVAALQTAGRMDPTQVAPDALRYSRWLFERGEFAAARDLLRPYLSLAPPDPQVQLTYATALLGCGEVAAAAAVLDAMPPCDQPDYYYQLGECRRILGRHAEAAEAFRAGLQAARNDHQREVFRQALARIPAEKNDDHER